MKTLQRCTWMVALLAFWGCGARSTLEVASASGSSTARGGEGGGATGGSGTGGSNPQHVAKLEASCAPDDGSAIVLMIDSPPDCLVAPSVSVLSILIWGQDLAGLHDGSVLMIGPGPNATTQAARILLPMGQGLLVTHGELVFTTFVEKGGATGTYDVTYTDDTTEQGSFDANKWCLGGATCG